MKNFIIIFFVMYRIFKWILFFLKKKLSDSIIMGKDGVLRTHVFIVKLCPKWTFQILKIILYSLQLPIG
jgi:hypothetical protein